MKRLYVILMTLILVFGISVSTHATLMDMGDGTIYDTDLQLSWLQDANYAKTSGFDGDGLMNWSDANTWADNLVFAGFDNWRLPTTLQPDSTCSNQAGISFGYNCTGSEMGHLYYTELGNIAGVTLPNTGDFTNLQRNGYWSSTEFSALPGGDYFNYAWVFVLDQSFGQNGEQGGDPKDINLPALAVRPGARSTSVPEPATLLLLGSGFAGIAVWRKRFGRKEG